MAIEEKNMELMKTLDDAWNSQDWDTFNDRHADDVAVFWPGQANATRGVQNHREESVEFFKMFPDNHLINNQYKILFYKDDYTCSITDFTDTFKGPMKGLNGQMNQPTKKKFHRVLHCCELEGWQNHRRKIIL